MRFIVDVIRALIRILALALGLFGLAGLVFEAIVLTAGDGRSSQSLGQVWFEHDPFAFLNKGPSIQLAQVFFERKLQMPSLWYPGITTLLNWPAWLALGAVGVGGLVLMAVLFRITRRRRAHV